MAGDVEVLVVDPRDTLSQREEAQALTEAGPVAETGRHPVPKLVPPQPAPVVAEGGALEQGQASDLKGRVGALDQPERGVLGR